ncbi:hypothetical protein GS904_03935 [Rhodococcus hoagii]|nr:hypothetical protein [Prescottella equi]
MSGSLGASENKNNPGTIRWPFSSRIQPWTVVRSPASLTRRVRGVHQLDRHAGQRPGPAGVLTRPAQFQTDTAGSAAAVHPVRTGVRANRPDPVCVADEHQRPRIRHLPVWSGEDLASFRGVCAAREERAPPPTREV